MKHKAAGNIQQHFIPISHKNILKVAVSHIIHSNQLFINALISYYQKGNLEPDKMSLTYARSTMLLKHQVIALDIR